MSAIGLSVRDEELDKYLLVGTGDVERRFPCFFYSAKDLAYAKQLAMTWLVAGFATRIIDVKPTTWRTEDPTVEVFVGSYQDVIPEVANRFLNLAGINALAPAGIVIDRYSYRITPPFVPPNMTDADFFTWLKKFSLEPATWTKPAPAGSSTGNPIVTTQSVTSPLQPPKPITTGVTHILHLLTQDTLCGCKGHAEPDLPFNVPLKRESTEMYCPECVSLKQMHHNDYNRGIVRMQMMQSPHIGFSQAQIEANRLAPIWEGDA